MEKIWLKSYPPGVPHDVQPEQYRSVAHLLEESFRKHASSPFSVCMDQWMSYGELERLSAALGAYLQGLGLEPGARVAIMLPNVPQFGVTMAAVLRAGYTCVNVNPLYTARELEHQLKDSGATAIVILENFAHTLAEVVDHTAVKHVVMASMGDLLGFWYGRWITFAVRHLAKMVPAYELPLTGGRKVVTFKKALSLGEHKSLAPSQATLDSIAFLQYTGGTTGLSKGAVLTHRNIVAATLQAEAWFTPALSKVGDLSKANSIAALPLYHIFALTLCLLAIRQGSSLTLIPNPRDIPKFIAKPEAQQVAHGRHHHMLHGGVVHHLGQRVREVLQDDDGRGARVLELVLQLAGGVQRVHVDAGVASAQHGGHGHAKLRDVGQHDGHPRTGLQPQALQIGAQRGRAAFQLAIGHPLVHADRERALCVFAERLFQQVGHRAVLLGLHVMRDARGVALEPDLFHARVSLCSPNAVDRWAQIVEGRRVAGYVFGGVMAGISFFLLNNVFGFAGNLQNWSPWLTAAAPGLIYSVLSLAAFGWLVLRR